MVDDMEHQIALADHRTTVTQLGDEGPPVVLVHAIGLDRRMWEPVMEKLAVGRRVYAYDLRGHGTAANAPIPYAMADTAADLIGVLDAFSLDRANVVGLSFGGAIAQTAAVAYPDRFASLALLATTDQPFDGPFESRARAAETEGMAAQVAPSLTRWFTPDALAENGWGVQYARECVRRLDAKVWAATWRAFKGLDVKDRLATFESPVLVINGGADAADAVDIATRIPGSIFVELPGIPHMQTLERPELVTGVLDKFLS
jgi:3-oxoadipate enol-lactonase